MQDLNYFCIFIKTHFIDYEIKISIYKNDSPLSVGGDFRIRLYLEYHEEAKDRSKYFMAPIFKRLHLHNHDSHKILIQNLNYFIFLQNTFS